MAREMSKVELKKWNDEMIRKQKLARGESVYEGKDIEGLMESGSSGKVWKKYKEQERAKAEHKAELAKIDTNISTQDKVKVFKELAERYSSSLVYRVGLVEAQKIGAETFQRFCEEANIKDIAVPSYHRFQKTKTREQFIEEKKSKKKEKKGVFFEESEKVTMMSFVEDLKRALRKRVKKGELSQEKADKQVNEALKGLERDFGIARKGLGMNKGLDIPENMSPDGLIAYYWEHIDEATDKDSLFLKEAAETVREAAEVEKDLQELSEADFLVKYDK